MSAAAARRGLGSRSKRRGARGAAVLLQKDALRLVGAIGTRLVRCPYTCVQTRTHAVGRPFVVWLKSLFRTKGDQVYVSLVQSYDVSPVYLITSGCAMC